MPPLYVLPCSLCVIENALGHVTADEWLLRIRPELGPRGTATVMTPNCVSSVHHLCVCSYVIVSVFVFVYVCVLLHRGPQGSGQIVEKDLFWGKKERKRCFCV